MNSETSVAVANFRLRRLRKVCLEHIPEEIPARQIAPVEPELLQQGNKDSNEHYRSSTT